MTCIVLVLRPNDKFAFLARVQLLAGLDQHKQAYDLLTSHGSSSSHATRYPLEMAYLLYKSKREKEALEVIERASTAGIKLDDTRARGLRVLEAQIVRRRQVSTMIRFVLRTAIPTRRLQSCTKCL